MYVDEWAIVGVGAFFLYLFVDFVLSKGEDLDE